MSRWILALGCILFCIFTQFKHLFEIFPLSLSTSLLYVHALSVGSEKRVVHVEVTQSENNSTSNNQKLNHEPFAPKLFQTKEKSIEFFPWDDGFDYGQICSNLIQVLSSFKNHAILNNGRYGGLGHKFLTVYNTVTAALVLGRPYYIHLEDVYWRSMNSCFESVKFTGDHRHYFRCNAKSNCVSPKSFSSIPNKDVLIPDIRFTKEVLCSDKTMKKINSYHIFGKDVTCGEYKRILLRLLTNPTSNTTKLILKKRSELGSPRHVVGVHIRSGGSTADSKERKVIIDPSSFKTLPPLIQNVVASFQDEVVIYLSTDSTHLEKYIQKNLPKGKVVTTSLFTRGHTTSRYVTEETIQRALVDIYLVSYAKTILYTQKSGFSSLCVSISNADSIHMIPSLL